MLLALGTHQCAGGRIEAHVAHAERRGVNRRGGARYGTNAREQLLGGKRLGQIVVGTGVQALNLIRHLAFGGEHDDWQALTGGTCAPEHLDAVHARHHDVQDRGVVVVGEQILERRQAVERGVDLVVAMLKNRGQGAGEAGFVLGKHQLHGCSFGAWKYRFRYCR